MAHYRLYFLDCDDHIRHAVSLECDHDDQAIELARGHADGRTLELWQGARRVFRLASDGADPA
ncbi:MAG TPA: hypothetical protein VIJ94_10365 [Caulobacteraceae bacterium]